jgi:hypothetical protein
VGAHQPRPRVRRGMRPGGATHARLGRAAGHTSVPLRQGQPASQHLA